MSCGEPDEDTESGAFGDAFDDEDFTYPGAAGVDGLVDQGGGPPVVGEIGYGNVARIGTLGVEFW